MKRLRCVLVLLGLAALLLATGCRVDYRSVAVLFVAHGEPATFEEGCQPVRLPDGNLIGPFGTTLRVPPPEQSTLWAMLYEEVAEAMTYIFGDFNHNGILHELAPFPLGDVPPFFTWPVFKGGAAEQYAVLGGSPHNATYEKHVANVKLTLLNKSVDVHMAYMDARPMIAEKVYELMQNQRYNKLVVVPLLLSESTHTQEIREEVREWVEKSGREIELVWGHSFFTEPYVRDLHAAAVAAQVEWVRSQLPAGVTDGQIGVVLAAHGDPYPPPYPEFGYKPGDMYSMVYLMEKDFHDAISSKLPYPTIMGINEFRPPSIESGIADLVAQGKQHIIVVPANFPSTSMHTMWDIAKKVVDQPVLPKDGVVVNSNLWPGATVYYSSLGYADREPGTTNLINGMRYCAGVGLLQLFEQHRSEYEYLFQ